MLTLFTADFGSKFVDRILDRFSDSLKAYPDWATSARHRGAFVLTKDIDPPSFRGWTEEIPSDGETILLIADDDGLGPNGYSLAIAAANWAGYTVVIPVGTDFDHADATMHVAAIFGRCALVMCPLAAFGSWVAFINQATPDGCITAQRQMGGVQ